MGILAESIRSFPVSNLSNPQQWLVDLWGGSNETVSGVKIDPEQAARITTVWACTSLLAEIVSSFPRQVFKRRKDGGKDLAIDHHLYEVLHNAANRVTSAFIWQETSLAHHLLWGNCYSYIERDRAGRPKQLWQLLPQYMNVKLENNDIVYDYDDGNIDDKWPSSEILHVPGLGFNGLLGRSRISQTAETLGLGTAAETFASKFFSGGGQPRILLKAPLGMSKTARKNLLSSFKEKYSGLQESWEVGLLEDGLEPHILTMPLQDSQLLESRKDSQATIAGQVFRVPPHVVGIVDKTTSWGTGIDSLTQGMKTFTIMPIVVRYENIENQTLLSQRERDQGYFIGYNMDSFSRADIETRYGAYAIGKQWGFLSTNDIRKKENLNPVENGDDYLQPANMIVVGSTPTKTPLEGSKRALQELGQQLVSNFGQRAEERIREGFVHIFKERLNEVANREAADIGRAKNRNDFNEWIERFLEEHPSFFDRKVRETLESCEIMLGEVSPSELPTDDRSFESRYNEYRDTWMSGLKVALEKDLSKTQTERVERFAKYLADLAQPRSDQCHRNLTSE
jgi:HK97 family phage portal protein